MSEPKDNFFDPFEGYQPDDSSDSDGISNFDSDVEFDHDQFDDPVGDTSEQSEFESVSEHDQSHATNELETALKHSSQQHSTLLQCLAWIARQHGVEFNAANLLSEFEFADEAPSPNEVEEIAEGIGLSAAQNLSLIHI